MSTSARVAKDRYVMLSPRLLAAMRLEPGANFFSFVGLVVAHFAVVISVLAQDLRLLRYAPTIPVKDKERMRWILIKDITVENFWGQTTSFCAFVGKDSYGRHPLRHSPFPRGSKIKTAIRSRASCAAAAELTGDPTTPFSQRRVPRA